MSFVTVGPEAMLAKAADLAGIASTISTANAIAAGETTTVAAPAADAVSTRVASVFDSYAQDYQALGTQMAALHDQLVQTMTGNANTYAQAEATNAQLTNGAVQSLLSGF